MRKTSGLSLLLLIFLSLCLITFALLSVSEAAANYRLSVRSADRTSEYYEANTAANELLAQIDAQLAAYLTEAESATDPRQTYAALCGHIDEAVPKVVPDGDSVISFAVPITDSQLLQVRLSIPYPEKAADTLYQVTEWKIVNTKEWNPDTSQNLLRLNTQDETTE